MVETLLSILGRCPSGPLLSQMFMISLMRLAGRPMSLKSWRRSLGLLTRAEMVRRKDLLLFCLGLLLICAGAESVLAPSMCSRLMSGGESAIGLLQWRVAVGEVARMVVSVGSVVGMTSIVFDKRVLSW